MKIDVLELSMGKKSKIQKEGSLSIPKEMLDEKEVNFSIITPISFSTVVTLNEGIYELCGNAEATCEFVCDRCLENFICDLEFDFKEEYKKDVKDDDIDYMKVIGDKIELNEEILLKNLILNIPLKLLCDENCPGINYSIEESKEEKESNSPFSVLKDVKF